MSVSMFRRAVRFAESDAANPAKNRLTEITAAILERHPLLARGFTAALLADAARNARAPAQPRITAAHAWPAEHGDTAEVLVATQLMRGGRFVDLQLRLAPDPLRRARDLLVWVEIKHGADISGYQLPAYLDLIEREPGAVRTLVVLAPRDSPPSAALVPDAVPVAYWQQVLGAVTRLPLDPQVSANALLTQELLAYFKEEGLMPAQPGLPRVRRHEQTVEQLKRKGVQFVDEVADRGCGPIPRLLVPGGGEVGLSQTARSASGGPLGTA